MFIESYLSKKIIFQTIKQYVFYYFKFFKLKNAKKLFKVKNSSLNLWYFLEEDWKSSFFGTHLIRNLLFINLFDKIASVISKNASCYYLQENQGWEKALIGAWRKFSNKKLIGIIHATVRSWDLRYFEDKKIYLNKHLMKRYFPDYSTINGPYAYKQYIDSGYPKNKLLKVEAHRYMHNLVFKSIPITKHKNLRILLLGEFDKKITESMLFNLNNLKIDNNINLFFRPHPGQLIKINKFSNITLVDHFEKIGNIIPNYDLIIGTGSTTAVLDAYIKGKKIIIFLNKSHINLSPLYQVSDVDFVSNQIELQKSILSYTKSKKLKKQINFFWLDIKLTKWKKVISDLKKID